MVFTRRALRDSRKKSVRCKDRGRTSGQPDSASIADYAWFPDPIVRLEYFFRRRRECGATGKESWKACPCHPFRGVEVVRGDVGEGVTAWHACAANQLRTFRTDVTIFRENPQ